MPLLNQTGDWWIAGIAGSGFYAGTIGSDINGNLTPQAMISVPTGAGERAWIDNKNAVFQRFDGDGVNGRLQKIDVTTSLESRVGGPITTVRGGGGVWAAFLSDNGVTGVFSSTGLSLPPAGLGDVGPDGAIALAASYQDDGPWYVHEKDGSEWSLTNNSALNIQLLGSHRAFWTEAGEPFVTGVPLPAPISRPFWFPRMIEAQGKWWILYQESADNRLVIHPVDSTAGYVIASGQDIFNPHVIILSNGKARVIWSTNLGETPDAIHLKDVDLTAATVDLGSPIAGGGSVGETVGTVSGATAAALTSTATFLVADASLAIAEKDEVVLPALPVESGYGRIVHPQLGAFDYEVKPDEWMNIDADVVVAPIWASTKTLTGAANVLWPGSIRDVVAFERWKPIGGLSMPITQLRMLMLIWTTPVDPTVGYVEWWPNYISPNGFKVIPVDLKVGSEGITLNDLINTKTPDGDPDGWVDAEITFLMKITGRV